MSCNGCRVLRKGCGDTCPLRACLQWIDTAEAQGHATAFVAKFFGRAALMSLISTVPHPQRPALFQSLLFEAVGRTINPVGGAVGLLWSGNWHLCQAAVDIVLLSGVVGPLPTLPASDGFPHGNSLPAADGFPHGNRRPPSAGPELCLSPPPAGGGREATQSSNTERSVTTRSSGAGSRLLNLFA